MLKKLTLIPMLLVIFTGGVIIGATLQPSTSEAGHYGECKGKFEIVGCMNDGKYHRIIVYPTEDNYAVNVVKVENMMRGVEIWVEPR